MKRKNILSTLAAISLLSFSSISSAELYVFGGGGMLAHEFVDVNNASAFKIGGGYMSRGNMGFEVSYMNLGDSAAPGEIISMSGTNFSGVFEMPLHPLVMSFKAGMYNIDARSTLYPSASSTGFSWGILLGYEPDDRMLIFMETEGFTSVNVTGGAYETPALLTFGVRFRL